MPLSFTVDLLCQSLAFSNVSCSLDLASCRSTSNSIYDEKTQRGENMTVIHLKISEDDIIVVFIFYSMHLSTMYYYVLDDYKKLASVASGAMIEEIII